MKKTLKKVAYIISVWIVMIIIGTVFGTWAVLDWLVTKSFRFITHNHVKTSREKMYATAVNKALKNDR